MTTEFVHQGLPSRVVFGSGTISVVPEEAARLGIKRALIVVGAARPDEGERLAALLGAGTAAVFAGAVMHTPLDVTAKAMDVVRDAAVDGIVAFGGGSAIGLSKAVAVRTGLPQLCIPATYAGSEMTPVLGETENGRKTTRRSLEILPETVIYDVELTLGLSARMSAVSGLNAVAHAVEALYAADGSPIVSLTAEEAIAAFGRALPAIMRDPGDRGARRDALYGAWLAGSCLAQAGMALHHKLCHVLGGAFDLPHAETHAVILPHALAYNTPAAPVAAGRIAKALGASDAVEGLVALSRAVGAPTSLAALGMPREGIARAVELAVATPYPNPRPLTSDGVRGLLERAFDGAPPRP